MQYYSRFSAASVFDETRPFFYYLIGPGQQPMQYCSNVEGGICLWWDQASFPLTCWTRPITHALLPIQAWAILLLPHWTNNYYPRPGLKVEINPYKFTLLPTKSKDKAFLAIVIQFSIGKMIKRRQNSITIYRIDRTSYHFHNRWA